MKRIISIVIISLLLALSGKYAVAAESTGTRIEGSENAYQKTVVWFSQPSEITDIRLLLQEGKKELAVEKAREYVASLENVAGYEAKRIRYFALNALCAALTSSGEIKEAIETCSRAIELNPSSWEALNTRGTAYYVSGQIELALEDYRKALGMVHGTESAADLIQFNIGLAEKKKTGSE